MGEAKGRPSGRDLRNSKRSDQKRDRPEDEVLGGREEFRNRAEPSRSGTGAKKEESKER